MDKVFLFVNNQKEFKENFPDNPNSNDKTHSEIHKFIYKELINNLAKGVIPIVLMCSYSENGMAIFHFTGFKANVYYYDFAGIVS